MISATSAQTTLFDALNPPDEQPDKRAIISTNTAVIEILFTRYLPSKFILLPAIVDL
jgi:hypothetical protein